MTDKPLLIKWRISMAAIKDQRLTGADLRVLPAVLDRMNDQLECWPGYGRIAADTGVDRRTANRAIDRLVEFGYLDKETRGNRVSNLYRIGNLSARLTIGRDTDTDSQTDSDVDTGTDSDVDSQTDPLSVQVSPELIPINLPIEPDPLNLPKASAGRFDEIWTAYPRKEGKAEALKTWKREKLDQHADKILADIQARLEDPGQWKGKDQEFIPYGSTYVNQRRWEDEWKPSTSAGTLPRETDEDIEAAHVEAQRKAATWRT